MGFVNYFNSTGFYSILKKWCSKYWASEFVSPCFGICFEPLLERRTEDERHVSVAYRYNRIGIVWCLAVVIVVIRVT